MRMRGWSLLLGGGSRAGIVKVVLVASSVGGFVVGQQLGHGALGAPPAPIQAAISGHIAVVPRLPATPAPSPTPTPTPSPAHAGQCALVTRACAGGRAARQPCPSRPSARARRATSPSRQRQRTSARRRRPWACQTRRRWEAISAGAEATVAKGAMVAEMADMAVGMAVDMRWAWRWAWTITKVLTPNPLSVRGEVRRVAPGG